MSRLTSPTGRDFLALVGTLLLIVASTIAAFELTGYLANRFANAKDQFGKPRHSNRSRTLASIFKNVAFFFFGMAGLFTALRDWVETRLGLTLGVGLGMAPPGDPAWHGFFRLGHMGHVNGHMILGLLGGIEAGLCALDIPHGRGAVEAAAAVIAGR